MLDFLKIKSGIEAVAGQARKLAQDIETKKQRRERLETAPLPRAEFAAKLCAVIDAQARDYSKSFPHIVGGLIYKPDFNPETSRLDILAGHGGVGGVIPQRNAAYFLRDIIKEGTKSAVAEMDYPDDEAGPPLADRQAEMTKLDAEIAKLEIEQEKIRSEANAAGIDLAGVAVHPAKGR